ncbi:hypothetical protein SU9_001355 [Streptomyces auratus AGR0001]|uniref:Uncharacterized protein n=1 Tax=Streptomyces auratus AGR0001 TaxID=1160718 RepID=J1RZ68_9ACTN|nr:hypothetical protein [Streptomyces auratus]QTZ90265.1 hypothetical protein SU9_001355 [Streptomyces auratus AGR0001]
MLQKMWRRPSAEPMPHSATGPFEISYLFLSSAGHAPSSTKLNLVGGVKPEMVATDSASYFDPRV